MNARKKDRVALVTGAGHGIGLGIGTYLAQEGYSVAVLDIDAKRCREAVDTITNRHGGTVLGVVADTAIEPQVCDAISKVRAVFGRLDAVVNNAGIPDPATGPVESLERETWDRYLAVNLTGYFLVAKHTVPMLRESEGAMVNIASVHALQSDANHNAAYAASKGGVIALTHALALSLGPSIRVNCVSPGWIDVRDQGAQELKPLRNIDHAQHPAGRVGEPRDIAALAAFLLSDEAAFITGENVIADGGMTRKMAYV